MGEVGQQKKGIKHNQMVDLDILSVFLPTAKTKEEEWDTKSTIEETHKKKIVVGEEKGKPTEQESSLMDGMQKVKEWNWD